MSSPSRQHSVAGQVLRPVSLREVREETSRYFPVPLQCLRVDTVADFSIYLRTPPHGDRYTFYREANVLFSEAHRQRLLDNGIESIYVPTAERRQYLRYLEDHVDTVMQDPNLSERERSEIYYSCASELVQDVFDDPRSGTNLKRARKMVDQTVQHVLRASGDIRSIVDVMSFDYYTYTHSVNVCVIGVALGHRLGVSYTGLRDLGTALLLHDTGKTEIDPAIIGKRGPLTDHEWEEMRTHPERGVRLLEDSGQVGPLPLEIIRQHHEKCSGLGYPRGLKDAEIHPFAKIASLADVFDALTTVRPYSEALKSFPAVQVMRNQMAEDFRWDFFREMVMMLGS